MLTSSYSDLMNKNVSTAKIVILSNFPKLLLVIIVLLCILRLLSIRITVLLDLYQLRMMGKVYVETAIWRRMVRQKQCAKGKSVHFEKVV